MNIRLFTHANTHLLGDSATHPIEPPWRALAALLLLAGIGPQRRAQRRAAPEQAQPPRGWSLRLQACLSRFGQATEAKRPASRGLQGLAYYTYYMKRQAWGLRHVLPAHPMTAHSDTSNCGF